MGDGPEDRWHREAIGGYDTFGWEEGTYELVGPKIQGNPENVPTHHLFMHGYGCIFPEPPREFDQIRQYLERTDIEFPVQR